MTDYNDGKWHGWRGRDCPVHPESTVILMFRNGEITLPSLAGEWCWSEDDDGTIVAFRVTKPYREVIEGQGG